MTSMETPAGSFVPCSGMEDRIAVPDNIPQKNILPALHPYCMNCTDALLTRPAGGLGGDRLLVHLYDYSGSGRVPVEDPSAVITYTFWSRSMEPGMVRLSISRVAGLYDTEALPMPETISVSIEPDRFMAAPGREYTSNVTVHVKPGTSLRENFWIHIHGVVDDVPDAITDDWVRLAIDDGSTMSGAGLYHFYQGTGGYCQDLLLIPQGGYGDLPFFVRTGELDTGTVTINLSTMPCRADHGPLGADELPPWPAGIQGTAEPAGFTGRSFANYLVNLSFSVDAGVGPGDYCFRALLRTPTGGMDFAPFTVRIVPR
ncbi:MAG TPA: hypothetical protein VLL74_03120 [Methanoregula sp.]|nr:hypothetical protein [Methanoregula sp.]